MCMELCSMLLKPNCAACYLSQIVQHVTYAKLCSMLLKTNCAVCYLRQIVQHVAYAK
jgi:hypothetical protein